MRTNFFQRTRFLTVAVVLLAATLVLLAAARASATGAPGLPGTYTESVSILECAGSSDHFDSIDARERLNAKAQTHCAAGQTAFADEFSYDVKYLSHRGWPNPPCQSFHMETYTMSASFRCKPGDTEFESPK